MAGYQCDSPDCPQPVTVLITSLNTGGTQTSCDEHIPIALIGNLAGYLEVNPQTLYDSIKRFSDREAARQAKAAAAAAEAALAADLDGGDPERDFSEEAFNRDLMREESDPDDSTLEGDQ